MLQLAQDTWSSFAGFQITADSAQSGSFSSRNVTLPAPSVCNGSMSPHYIKALVTE
jgi:hypothetical protein